MSKYGTENNYLTEADDLQYTLEQQNAGTVERYNSNRIKARLSDDDKDIYQDFMTNMDESHDLYD